MIVRPVLVRPLPNYRIYLEFSDGTKGEVDLSDLAGQGVFEAWNDPTFFQQVRIGNHREVRWDDEIELCADSLYLRLTGKTPEELFPKLHREQPHA
ncbi:MAG: DUF2442 domain-containing protein [Acidobacteriota bacterium]|nr:DUF2442 domain-containing protein [Acidobacteriota bacterium]